jgi:hypothetical protein
MGLSDLACPGCDAVLPAQGEAFDHGWHVLPDPPRERLPTPYTVGPCAEVTLRVGGATAYLEREGSVRLRTRVHRAMPIYVPRELHDVQMRLLADELNIFVDL